MECYLLAYIPKQLQDARFRAPEKFMFKARILLMVVLGRLRRTGLETYYAALLISTIDITILLNQCLA